MNFNIVNTIDDIQHLLQSYGGFHDSCIHSAQYVSGACVDDNGGMGQDAGKSEFVLKLHSQAKDVMTAKRLGVLEMYFGGVQSVALRGLTDNRFCDIFDCHLAFHGDVIVWADSAGFTLDTWANTVIGSDNTTVIVAKTLKWRIV